MSDRWTPLSRVLGYDAGPKATYGLVWYDRLYAQVPQYRRGPLPDWRKMKIGPPTIGYEMGGKDRALVIGGGGGRDIYNALSSGVRRLDVIELNRGIKDTVDGPTRDFSGAPYSRPGVHTTVGDGRSELAHRDTHYNVMALSLILVAAPLVLTARRARPPARALAFFGAIGLGFLTLEIVLIQRFVLFLGFPTYALSVVLFALLL